MSAPAPPLSRPDRIFEGYIFDLDGTVYLGDQLLPGSARLFTALRELERHTVFVEQPDPHRPINTWRS